MCDEDTAVARGKRQHVRVLETRKADAGRGPEVNFRVATLSIPRAAITLLHRRHPFPNDSQLCIVPDHE